VKVVRKIKEMQGISQRLRGIGKNIGLVPTMGALHAGHLSLIKRSCRDNDITVVSIFVNPTQFGAGEDLRRYPRPLHKDLALCRKSGVDFVFCPSAQEVYPRDFRTYITVEGLSSLLCGKSRPGHFRGVATVVAKLFNIVQPQKAYFGQKDAQQAVIIQKMGQDLNFPLEIKTLPTIRDKDGLAMSSRNIYLNKKERSAALALPQALKVAQGLIRRGQKDCAKIISAMKKIICARRNARVDYLSIVDSRNLQPLKKIYGRCLVLLAVYIGKTRLIDNTIVK
jgi:pantoate--beta-alanine ligase